MVTETVFNDDEPLCSRWLHQLRGKETRAVITFTLPQGGATIDQSRATVLYPALLQFINNYVFVQELPQRVVLGVSLSRISLLVHHVERPCGDASPSRKSKHACSSAHGQHARAAALCKMCAIPAFSATVSGASANLLTTQSHNWVHWLLNAHPLLPPSALLRCKFLMCMRSCGQRKPLILFVVAHTTLFCDGTLSVQSCSVLSL